MIHHIRYKVLSWLRCSLISHCSFTKHLTSTHMILLPRCGDQQKGHFRPIHSYLLRPVSNLFTSLPSAREVSLWPSPHPVGQSVRMCFHHHRAHRGFWGQWLLFMFPLKLSKVNRTTQVTKDIFRIEFKTKQPVWILNVIIKKWMKPHFSKYQYA